MVFFHDILCSRIPLYIPQYLRFFDGKSRLRSTHLDILSLVSSLFQSSTGVRNLEKSSYYRSHNVWNSLPFHIRSCWKKSEFKNKVELNAEFWNLIKEHRKLPNGDPFFSDSNGNVGLKWHLFLSHCWQTAHAPDPSARTLRTVAACVKGRPRKPQILARLQA